jgi:hypothetical protein
MKFPRSSGVLLHPTSLPGRHGLDPELISPDPNAALVGPLEGCRSPLDSGFFIVTPEIVASLFFGGVMNHLLGNHRLTAVVAGGGFMLTQRFSCGGFSIRKNKSSGRKRSRIPASSPPGLRDKVLRERVGFDPDFADVHNMLGIVLAPC